MISLSAYSRGDEDDHNSCMEILLGLTALQVMIEVEAQAGINRQMLPNSGDLNPLTSITHHSIWSMNPSYIWGQIGWIRDMYTTRIRGQVP